MKTKLLLLHGALGSKSQFNILKKLLSDTYEVYTLDFEGHGENASNNDFSIDLFTKNVITFLLENKIESINIFGYSMGGYVALNLAVKAPEYVNKIVTLGTKFNWTPETAAKEVKMLNPNVIEEKVPAFAKHLEVTHHKNNWKAVLNKTAKMMLELGDNRTLTHKVLESIKQNVLVGIGSKDKMVSIEESQESVTSLPNATLQIVEGFPHQIEKTDQEQLVSIITTFINS